MPVSFTKRVKGSLTVINRSLSVKKQRVNNDHQRMHIIISLGQSRSKRDCMNT